MNEAGVLAATMNQPEVLVEGAVELEREVRRSRLSRVAQTSSNFLAASEQDDASALEAEDLRPLSAHAAQFLKYIAPESANTRLFSSGEVDQLVHSLLQLHGPAKRVGINSLDYGMALTVLFSSQTSTYGTVAEEVFNNSANSTYISLRKYALRCAANAKSSDIDLVTVDDIISVTDESYVPNVRYRPAEVTPEVSFPATTGSREDTFRPMATVAIGPVFPPEPPRPAINNPYTHESHPAPKPRDTDDDNPLAWQREALCAQTDPEAFFPEKGGSTRDAKRVCTTCDVRDRCLDYALQNDERFGIWGGLSERERRKLKRRA